ncbi:DUF4189 domain-containing protein [Dyella aluminiiresistens]|uniref:DUF4189 domain-containing protein n=1 Tax=Dyella aluminiiresistens TaxID=3069105 RepID=UPI00399CFBAF
MNTTRLSPTRYRLWLLGLALLVLCRLVHAQEQVGPCPPGMSEYPGANGIPSCGAQVQQRPVIWASRWGAIAWDYTRGAVGGSINQPSKAAAEQAAIANCRSNDGGPDCKTDFVYHDQCVALVTSAHTHTEASGYPLKVAINNALKICTSAGHADCTVDYTSCVAPVRVQ